MVEYVQSDRKVLCRRDGRPGTYHMATITSVGIDGKSADVIYDVDGGEEEDIPVSFMKIPPGIYRLFQKMYDNVNSNTTKNI